MSEQLRQGILMAWRGQREYAQQLVADLNEEEMVSSPVEGVVMNHPAWVLSHLEVYCTVLASMFLGEEVEDPMNHRYGWKSKPVTDKGEYPGKDELVAKYVNSHDKVERVVEGLDLKRFEDDTPLERLRQRFPTLGELAVYLMVHHEGVHLGQLSAWRRAGGRASVSFIRARTHE